MAIVVPSLGTGVEGTRKTLIQVRSEQVRIWIDGSLKQTVALSEGDQLSVVTFDLLPDRARGPGSEVGRARALAVVVRSGEGASGGVSP